MSTGIENEDRALNTAEREMIAQTRPPVIDTLSEPALQALRKRIRQARDRYRRIAGRQQREMRGKASPRHAVPAAENAGSEQKVAVLLDGLKRITQAVRKLNAPSGPELARKALAAKRAAPPPQHPGAGRTASAGMAKTKATKPATKVDPREVGRVSKAGKVAQARRDRS